MEKRKYYRVAQYFIHKDRITQGQADTALAIQKVTPNKRLGKILINLGFITQTELVEYLSQYNPEALVEEKTIYTTFSKNLLKEYQTVILSESRDYVFIATVNPDIKPILEKMSGKQIKIEPVSLDFFLEQFQETNKDTKELNLSNPNDVLSTILKDAINKNSSDIHIEIVNDFTAIRYRIDGVLHLIHVLPRNAGEMLVARIKGLSNMDIAEKKYPQDGSFSFDITTTKEIYIRTSTVPAIAGEVIVLRLLDKDKVLISLDKLGLRKLDLWKRAISERNGLILVTGATGSGKSTTLYTTMLHLDRLGKNIITIEDPVEYQFPFIRQVQVNRVLDLDFKVFLKHAMRQDPDIILVGEVRDEETARAMLQAAETGHLVFATLHSNNIPSTFSRLLDLGIKITDIKFLLRCILSQTLLRRVCNFCYGKGCKHCDYSGYRGRALVSEIMLFNEHNIEPFVNNEFHEYFTLLDDAIQLSAEGITDAKELERVFGISAKELKDRIKQAKLSLAY